LNQLPIFR